MNIKCFWPALNPAHGTQSKFSPQEGPRWPPVPGSSRALPSISSSWQSLSRAPPSPSPCAGCGSRARGAALWHRAVLGARWLLPSPDCRGFSSSPEHTLSLGEAGQPALHGSTVVLGELLLPGSGRWELPHPELRTRGGIPGSSPAADCSGLGIFQPFSSSGRAELWVFPCLRSAWSQERHQSVSWRRHNKPAVWIRGHYLFRIRRQCR